MQPLKNIDGTKTVPHVSYPLPTGIARVLKPVRPFWGLVRDLIKSLYLAGIQIWTRLFYIERGPASAISLWARLDVIPRARHHERHRLALGGKSLIETEAVVCTWHGDVILDDGAGVGIGSVVIGPVQMGKDSICSQYCFISGYSHCYQDISVSFRRQGSKIDPVVIGKNVWIGSNSVVLPGVRIGDNSVIGAGSTIVKDVPPCTVTAGKPARVIKRYDPRARRWLRV
jgi:acetyltransferase-like isoleucine patch superfamily enzyme